MAVELARALIVNGNCLEAMQHLTLLANLDPPVARAFPLIAQCHAQRGDLDQAIATMRSMPYGVPYTDAVLAFLLAQSGETEDAIAILESLLELHRSGRGNAYPIAIAYAGLRHFDAALEWLDRAIDDRSVRESIVEPLYAELHRQADFARIARELGIDVRP